MLNELVLLLIAIEIKAVHNLDLVRDGVA